MTNFFFFPESHSLHYYLNSLKGALFKISLVLALKSDSKALAFFSTQGRTKMQPWQNGGGKSALLN